MSEQAKCSPPWMHLILRTKHRESQGILLCFLHQTMVESQRLKIPLLVHRVGLNQTLYLWLTIRESGQASLSLWEEGLLCATFGGSRMISTIIVEPLMTGMRSSITAHATLRICKNSSWTRSTPKIMRSGSWGTRLRIWVVYNQFQRGKSGPILRRLRIWHTPLIKQREMVTPRDSRDLESLPKSSLRYFLIVSHR